MSKTYRRERKEVEEAQKGMTYDQVKELMKRESEFLVELDRLPSQKHRWVDRGMKLSCEGAGHPYHQIWKKKR